jgi:hypothetical protein
MTHALLTDRTLREFRKAMAAGYEPCVHGALLLTRAAWDRAANKGACDVEDWGEEQNLEEMADRDDEDDEAEDSDEYSGD